MEDDKMERARRMASVESNRPPSYDDPTDRLPANNEIPSFVRVLIIVDLVFCCLQLFQVCFGGLGLIFMEYMKNQVEELEQIMTTELLVLNISGLVVSLLIFAIGLTACITLLRKMRLGLTLGYVSLGFVLLSMILGFAGLFFQPEPQGFQDPNPAGTMAITIASAIVGLIIRIAVNAPIAIALYHMREFFKKQDLEQ